MSSKNPFAANNLHVLHVYTIYDAALYFGTDHFQLQLWSDKNSAEGLSLREQTAQHFEMQLFQISIDRTSNVLRSPADVIRSRISLLVYS